MIIVERFDQKLPNLLVACALLGQQFKSTLGLNFVSEQSSNDGYCHLSSLTGPQAKIFDVIVKPDSDELALAFRDDQGSSSKQNVDHQHSLLLFLKKDHISLECRAGRLLQIGKDTIVSQELRFDCEDLQVILSESGRNADGRLMILDVKINRKNQATPIFDGIAEIYSLRMSVAGARISLDREIYDTREGVVAVYNDNGIVYLRNGEPGSSNFQVSMMRNAHNH